MKRKDCFGWILALALGTFGLRADLFCSPAWAADASQSPGTNSLAKPGAKDAEI